MKVIVNVQPQTQSSRGLVHYIAHSKIDAVREPSGARELFNDRTDSISVQQANFMLKTGVSANRPQNSDLHHLVISVRPEDYRKLGTNEKERVRSLKDIGREAMRGLERLVGSESLDWVAAVHRNTDNPHVHIAISKRFISPQLDSHQRLTRIPKEALPHYDLIDGKRTFVPGGMIDAATQKMGQIIEHNLAKEHAQPKHTLSEDKLVDKNPERPTISQEMSKPKQPIHEVIHVR